MSIIYHDWHNTIEMYFDWYTVCRLACHMSIEVLQSNCLSDSSWCCCLNLILNYTQYQFSVVVFAVVFCVCNLILNAAVLHEDIGRSILGAAIDFLSRWNMQRINVKIFDRNKLPTSLAFICMRCVELIPKTPKEKTFCVILILENQQIQNSQINMILQR